MIIVLDFVFVWNEFWVSGEYWGWVVGLLVLMFVMYVMFVVLFVEMYESYVSNRECY